MRTVDILGLGIFFVVGVSTSMIAEFARHRQKRLGTTVSESEEKLREQAKLLDIATDAIFVRNMDHTIVYWNKGAERTFGWTAAEAIGKNAEWLFGATDRPNAYGEVSEKGEWAGELQRKTKSGRIVTIQARWTAIRDPRGELRSILTVNTDVTAQRNLQKQLIRSQRLESIGTLAGGIAHDLNNILSPILMGVETLSMRSPDERTRKILSIMKTATLRGTEIVRQVLGFARGVGGERAEVQLKHIIHEVEVLIKETFPKNIEIKCAIPKDLPLVMANATEMQQVLMNLCVNARDAMPKGGTLSVSAESVKLDEGYVSMHIEAKAINYVRTSVQDTGTGINPEMIEKIFDPFFTTKEVGKGTGLGLSTVLSIVQGHGGFINVYSEVGKGSKFKVYIPAIKQKMDVEAEKAVEGIRMGQGETILVVDDESSVREMIKQILESYDYRVLLAGNGKEATEQFSMNREEIAVVVTDMMMPQMDGPATILKLLEIDPKIKIIAMSGLMTAQKAEEVARLGVKASLMKPFTADALIVALQDVLETIQRSAPA
jgi:PAS domain S-box-containing protein